MKFKKKQKAIFAGRLGFTLVEIIIVVSIVSIIMVSLAGIFSSSIRGYRAAKATQRDLEDAQFIMNQMVKILRTSSVNSSSTSSEIKIYDYSLNRCYQYRFHNNKIQSWFVSMSEDNESDPVGWCASQIVMEDDYKDMAAFYVEGNFLAIPSIDGKLGKVTVSMKLCQDSSCLEDRTRIQSSVSLRDYYKAGI